MSGKRPSPEIVQQVRAEVAEHLAQIEGILLRLDREPGSAAEIGELFRRIHTIKGVAGVLESPALVEIAHRTESFLESFREEARPLSPADLDLLLQARDLLERSSSGEEVDLAPFRDRLPGGGSPSADLHEAAEAASPEGPAASEEAAEEESGEPIFFLFRVRGRLCAFPVERIREISLPLAWRRVPFTAPSFLGMGSLRGQLVPVIDLARILELPGNGAEGGRVLFLECGEELVGCFVERPVGVAPLPGWEASAAALRHFGIEAVSAVAAYRGEVVSILAPEPLLDLASVS